MTKSFLHRDKDAQAAPGSTQLSLAPGTASSSLSLQPAGLGGFWGIGSMLCIPEHSGDGELLLCRSALWTLTSRENGGWRQPLPLESFSLPL